MQTKFNLKTSLILKEKKEEITKFIENVYMIYVSY